MGDSQYDTIQQDEISVGIPVKISTSSMLAMDLRSQICGDVGDCALEKEWFDTQFWNVDRFTEAYLNQVSDLFNIKVNPTATDASGIAYVNDTELWDRKWVFCTVSLRQIELDGLECKIPEMHVGGIGFCAR